MAKETKDSNQAERFAAAARERKADESGRIFERAFGKIVPVKKPKKTPPKPTSEERD